MTAWRRIWNFWPESSYLLLKLRLEAKKSIVSCSKTSPKNGNKKIGEILLRHFWAILLRLDKWWVLIPSRMVFCAQWDLGCWLSLIWTLIWGLWTCRNWSFCGRISPKWLKNTQNPIFVKYFYPNKFVFTGCTVVVIANFTITYL